MDSSIENMKHIFFIGIGGIGMSAIARFYNERKIKVSGYDKTETMLTRKLVAENIEIFYEDQLDQYPKDVDLVIYTPAIPQDHKGLSFYKGEQYPVIKRAEALGEISKSHRTIAIAGTHGKTSTSSMVAHLLNKGRIDASAFLGGIPVDYNSNFLSGKGDWVIVEADEFDRSFLHLSPEIAAIMSVDADHLDIYGAHEDMLDGFKAFVQGLKPKGILLLSKIVEAKLMSDKTFVNAINDKQIETVSFSAYEEADVWADKIEVVEGLFRFDVKLRDSKLEGFELQMAGRHNIENALVGIFIAYVLGEPHRNIVEKLSGFSGIKRRFEKIYQDDEVTFIDDYAHHPTELRAAINAARELYPDRKITVIFQPHLYSRTRDFADGFAEALDALDEILLMDIYPARELPIDGVSSEMIFNKMKNENKVLVNMDNVLDTLRNKELDVLITLGAGDIDTRVPIIKDWLQNRK